MEDFGSRNRPRDKAYIGHLRTQHIITTVIVKVLYANKDVIYIDSQSLSNSHIILLYIN